MSEGYTSPFPVVIERDYFNRIEGQAPYRRLHVFKKSDGSTIRCNPRNCREHYREGGDPLAVAEYVEVYPHDHD